MSGTIPLSLTQQFNEFGKPLKGGQLFLIQAGTVSTPQDSFQDSQLTIKMPYPITLDAAGRIPQFFLADGFIKVRLQDARGVVQLAADAIQVIGPSGGGGGGTPVDPNALIQMGNIIGRYGAGVLGGYVRLNALTIGSPVSGATERANADTQALFQYLWITDPTLSVSGGRGASAAADWAANKRLTLPDGRNRALAGLADMGNANVGLLTDVAFTKGNATTLGSLLGAARRILGLTNLPSHTHTGNTGNDTPDHTHNVGAALASGVFSDQTPGSVQGSGNQTIGSTGASVRHTHPFTTNATGDGAAFDAIDPWMLITLYMKL